MVGLGFHGFGAQVSGLIDQNSPFALARRDVMPAISVVMPVYNQCCFVEQSVRSILAQTFCDFELLIGDDGSDDGTSALLERLAHEDSRIRLMRRAAKSGLSASANWVVNEARAPLVAIAHGDDVCHLERLERQVKLLSASPDAVAVGSVAEGIDQDGRVVQPPNLWSLVRASPFAPFAHSSVMFRRAAFDLVGGYRDQCEYYEDLDLWWRLSSAGRMLVTATPLIRYRHSPSSSRGRYEAAAVEQALERMYRAAERQWQGRDSGAELAPAANAGRCIRPRIFVARSWVALWCGKRPGVFRAMVERARFRADLASLQSLAFVAWATVSPKSLRLALTGILGTRNALARRLLAGRTVVEWQPRRGARRETADGCPQEAHALAS